ncbi:MAG: hypothetical protein AAFQ98_17380, partial [Bacteroidota bacterium]
MRIPTKISVPFKEYLYGLFLLSGLLKAICEYYFISLPDITLICAILLIGTAGYHLLRHRIKIEMKVLIFLSAYVLFVLWVLFSLLYTPSKVYSINKVLFFQTNSVALFFPLVVKDFRTKPLIQFFVVLVLLVSGWYFLRMFNDYFLRSNVMHYIRTIKSLYLTLGLYFGIIILLVRKRYPFRYPVINYGSAILCFLFLLISGARGPLIFLVICLLVRFGVRFPQTLRKRIAIRPRTLFISAALSMILTVVIVRNFQLIEPAATRAI